ncbi:hypothetical protein AB0O28_21400 [Microbispora sp. NPDC088329]|uniref:hypothetical protein n=1 Tax=Microbispora sp. NPDC088329 TaxID=3154869 RepID=UPI00341AEA6B
MAFRIGQGVFGGLLIPQGFVLLVRVIPRESMGRLFGLFGPLLAVSSISGPVVAGLLIELDPFGLSWRSVFLLNVLFGVLMLVAGLKVIPPFGGDASIRIRPGAAFTLMAGLGLLLAGLVDGGTSEWTARALVGTVAGAVALAAFAWQQARTSRPLLERSLFGNRGFVAGLGMGCCFGDVFAVALGDVNAAQAGSAGGVLNAVQQIVNAAGSAIVSTVYLATVTPGAPSSGVLPCLLLTLAITAACAMSIPLLPRRGVLAH